MAKVITIKQPWADLIVNGIKDVENRTWQTTFRGRVLIHASMKSDISGNVGVRQLLSEHQRADLMKRNELVRYLCHKWVDGAIIGSVEIYDVQTNVRSMWAEQGTYNWLLRNPVAFENPLCGIKGKLGIWEIEDELVKDLKV